MHSTNLTIVRDRHGTPNALYDGLNRVVVSFPTDRTHDIRRGSPSTPETIEANAKLFLAAANLPSGPGSLLDTLANVTAALDTVLIHQGQHMTPDDLYQRRMLVAATKHTLQAHGISL